MTFSLNARERGAVTSYKTRSVWDDCQGSFSTIYARSKSVVNMPVALRHNSGSMLPRVGNDE